ncbi:MAG TPA: cytochrome P450 [Polyangiaceae bacterium]|nr:cytochrome P450 [Polyangiaceae bacterium]
MLNLLTDDMRRNPYPMYDQVRGSAPVLQMPGADIWMILDYEGVKRALFDQEAFSSRASAPGDTPLDWLIFTDPPRHTKLRSIVLRAFTPRSVANLEPRIRELSQGLLDQVIERGEMDLCEDYSSPLPLSVIAEMIGIPTGDWPLFRLWSDVILGLSDVVVGDGEEKARAVAAFAAAKTEMQDYLAGLLKERRAAPKDDLLTRLVEAEVDGERLSEAEILDFFLLLLVAGSETTTNLISNAVLSFIEHPGELVRLQATPALLSSAIEEVLRYRSPVQAVFRETKRDVEIHGQVIPAGKLVLPMIGSANRDPKQFPDADRLDIDRNPNPHIAFGHGIHFCIGAPLARLEAKVALGDLIARVKGIELAGSEPWEPRKAFHVHGPTSLPIRFDPGPRIAVPG